MVQQIKNIAIVVLLYAFIGSCTNSEDHLIICPDEFRVFYLDVYEPTGERADSVDVTITHFESGQELDFCPEDQDYQSSCENLPIGRHIIMHDGMAGHFIKDKKEYFYVEGKKEDLKFIEGFTFKKSDCGILMITGTTKTTLSADL